MRWPIETCFEDGQPWLGMGDDEVRVGPAGTIICAWYCWLTSAGCAPCSPCNKSPGLDHPATRGALGCHIAQA